MVDNDEANGAVGTLPLKRKAISCDRLQDPKLWNKISWIRTSFVEDDESGVRKTDFYNLVTAHLGKMGYRDVWHLLKIAYPHVERVRRGRMYMYWGVRQVCEGIGASDPLDEESGEQTDISSPMERLQKMDDQDIGDKATSKGVQKIKSRENSPVGSTPLLDVTENSMARDIRIKKEPGLYNGSSEGSHQTGVHGMDVDISENDMEIRVYTSFEDYRNSSDVEGAVLGSGTVNEMTDTRRSRPRRSRRSSLLSYQSARREDRHIEMPKRSDRSTTPPRQIFAAESFIKKESAKESSDSGLQDFSDINSPCDTWEADRDGEEHSDKSSWGDEDNGGQHSRASSFDEELPEQNSTMHSQASGDLSTYLLEPDNINKVCIPLISNSTAKATRRSHNSTKLCHPSSTNNNTEAESMATQTYGSEMCSEEHELEEEDQSQASYCDPIIVSVASIASLPEEPVSDITASELESEEWVETKDTCTQTENQAPKVCSIHGRTLTTAARRTTAGAGGTSAASRRTTAGTGASNEQVKTTLKSKSASYDFPDAVKMIMISSSYNPVVPSKVTSATVSAGSRSSPTSGVTWSTKGQRPILPKTPAATLQSASDAPHLTPTRSLPRQQSSISPNYLAEDNNNLNENLNENSNNQRFPKVSGNATRFARSPENVRTMSPGIQESSLAALVAREKASNAPTELNTRKSISPTAMTAGKDAAHIPSSVSPTGILARALANKMSGKTVATMSKTELINALRASADDGITQERGRFDQMLSPNIATDALGSEPAGGGLLAEARFNSILVSNPIDARNGSQNGPSQTSKESIFNLPESSRGEAIRKLLGEQELQRNSPLHSSLNDLRARVQCLSAELEKERSVRMQLEVELRKTKSLLIQERCMNDNLAFMLTARK